MCDCGYCARFTPIVARRLARKRQVAAMPFPPLYWVPTLFESIQRDKLANALYRYPEQRSFDLLDTAVLPKMRGVTYNAPDFGHMTGDPTSDNPTGIYPRDPK